MMQYKRIVSGKLSRFYRDALRLSNAATVSIEIRTRAPTARLDRTLIDRRIRYVPYLLRLSVSGRLPNMFTQGFSNSTWERKGEERVRKVEDFG